MATVRELVTSWGFDIDEKPLKELDNHIKGIKTTISHVAIAAGAAVAGIFGIVATTASAGEEAAKTAQKIGMQIGKLQELQYAAHLSDIANEELTVGLKFLSSNMYDAANKGGEAAKKFSALGIQVKGADGKLRPVDETLMSIADKFKAMPDGVEKTSLAVDLFGRSGINMIPLLNKGSAAIAEISDEARKFGLVLDEATVKQGEEFMDGMKRLKGLLVGIKNEIGAALLPILNNAIAKFIDWARANRELISQNLKLFLGEVVKLLGKLMMFAKDAYQFIANLVEAFGGFEKVLKFVIKAMLLFLGLKLTYALGGIIFGIMNTVKAFAMLGNAALLAQLKILAIPLAIGAAIVAVGLIIEDIIAFFQGRNSVTGILVEKFKEAAPKILSFLGMLGDSIAAWVMATGRKIIDAAGSMIAGVVAQFAEKFPTVYSIIKSNIDLAVASVRFFAEAFKFVWEWMMRISRAVNAVMIPIVNLFKTQAEQIRAFFTEVNTFISPVVEVFKWWAEILQGIFAMLNKGVGKGLTAGLSAYADILKSVTGIGTKALNVGTENLAKNEPGTVGATATLGSKKPESLGFVDRMRSMITPQPGTMAGAIAGGGTMPVSTPQNAPAPSSRPIISNREFKPNLNITVQGGMTNEQTGGVVADHVMRVFQDMMSEAGRDFEPAIER